MNQHINWPGDMFISDLKITRRTTVIYIILIMIIIAQNNIHSNKHNRQFKQEVILLYLRDRSNDKFEQPWDNLEASWRGIKMPTAVNKSVSAGVAREHRLAISDNRLNNKPYCNEIARTASGDQLSENVTRESESIVMDWIDQWIIRSIIVDHKEEYRRPGSD